MCCKAESTPRARPRLVAARGFSLLEVMVVLVILGLLAGLITVNVRGRMQTARQSIARTEIATIVSALEEFYTIYGRYPTNDEGLEILSRPTERRNEPLLNALPLDPWGNAYEYRRPGRNHPYEVTSFGADGREGGEGGDADIVSSQLQERRGL